MSGEAVPHDPTKKYSCEGLRLMHSNLASLEDLRNRQQKLMAEALQLQQDTVDFKESFKSEIDAVLARTPLTIKPRKVKVDLDAEATGADQLPPPLLPQVVPSEAASVALLGEGDRTSGVEQDPAYLVSPAQAAAGDPQSDCSDLDSGSCEAAGVGSAQPQQVLPSQ